NALGLQFTNPSAAPIASPQAQRSEVFMTPSPLRWLQPKNSNALHALASTFFLLLARGPAEALFVRVTQSRDTLRCSTVSAYRGTAPVQRSKCSAINPIARMIDSGVAGASSGTGRPGANYESRQQ